MEKARLLELADLLNEAVQIGHLGKYQMVMLTEPGEEPVF